MALTDKIEWFIGITDEGLIELQKSRVIFDDGQEVGRKNFRQVLTPGSDVTSFPSKIRQVAQVIWTPQVIAAWQAKQGQ